MFVCVVSSSQPIRENDICYVKCLCVLSRYLSPVVEIGICYLLNACVCVVSLSQPSSRENGICYVKCVCVCVCCLVISAQ